MTTVIAATTDQPKLSIRSGSSRKLLERKAAAKANEAATPEADALEASFPDARTAISAEPTGDDVQDATSPANAESDEASTPPPMAAPAPAAAPAPLVPVAAATWSAEDESALQTLVARRKAAGYQRRGKDVDGQLVTPGSFKPNPDTIVAVIVGMVAERAIVSRSDLIDAMALAAFPHARARPTDRGWCQGYVAGAIRNGFLTLAEQPVASVSEAT